ncbi:MAG: efflux RND transporter periplasmic adaptor subunit [Bacteroidota bacterium]|nr:efflux RND transporter periplasmic adaptor subunit [Bacteroidota bacterium]MDP4247193.1 efflux RND transporter periplasmic adaptor subunit [Bacteroidota bacterium]MDP4254796.1 efflux RND transporter periplasmic adaptor subunit [Bacteroidota bacterium]
MRKFKVLLIIISILLAGAAVWYFFFRKEEKPVVLLTEKPSYGYISKSVTATGTIQPVDTVSVGSQVSGTIKSIYTDFNAKVKKGQLLAELDKSLFEAQANQYRANLEVSRSTLNYQKSNFDRQTLLFNAGAISKADFENAQNLYNTAKANVMSVQAQVDASEKNLSYASIYSPVDGVVMTRNISVGQTVAASFNTPTLFVIAKDISNMQVQAAVSEADIGDVKIGLRVTFTVDAYPDITFTGMVKQIRLEPAVSANVVTYSTIITAPNEDLKLKPGMTANIFIYTKEVDSALLISSKDLKFVPDATMAKQFVIVPAPQGGGGTGGGGTRGGGGGGARTGHGGQAASGGQSGNGVGHRHDTTAGQEIDTSARTQRASVWVKDGDTLREKRIRVGLNDDTHAQVLRGLTTDDDVITGIEIPVPKAAAGGAPARSPFMPARRGGGGGGGRPGGGGGGGGGARPAGGGR